MLIDNTLRGGGGKYVSQKYTVLPTKMRLQRRLFRICFVRFLALGFLVCQNGLISVLNNLVNN